MNNLSVESKRGWDWGLWIQWILVSNFGWAAGDAISGVVFRLLFIHVGWITGWTLGWIVGGVLLGVSQWLILRRQLQETGQWIFASAIGWAAGEYISISYFGGIIGGAVLGAVIGIAQWLILRGLFQKSGWWILAGTLSGAIGWAIGNTVGGAIAGSIAGSVYGIVYGIITGTVLVFISQTSTSFNQKLLLEITGLVLATLLLVVVGTITPKPGLWKGDHVSFTVLDNGKIHNLVMEGEIAFDKPCEFSFQEDVPIVNGRFNYRIRGNDGSQLASLALIFDTKTSASVNYSQDFRLKR